MTDIYHICHVDNLLSIVGQGGLHCGNMVATNGINPIDIGYSHIKSGRANRRVPIAPHGVLSDYVPFYFAPRSPMLFTISKGNVPTYTGTQEQIVHLVVDAERIRDSNIPFVFTDGHAIIDFSEFYSDLSDLSQIDWNIMKAIYWYDIPEDNDRKRRRQAEFLIYNFVPWPFVHTIGVMSRRMVGHVQNILSEQQHIPQINLSYKWYYL